MLTVKGFVILCTNIPFLPPGLLPLVKRMERYCAAKSWSRHHLPPVKPSVFALPPVETGVIGMLSIQKGSDRGVVRRDVRARRSREKI